MVKHPKGSCRKRNGTVQQQATYTCIRGLVSKQTAVLRHWGIGESKQMFGLSMELITKGKLATIKRFEV